MNLPTSLGWARIIGYVVLGFMALYAIRSFGGGPNPLTTWLASGPTELHSNRATQARDRAHQQQAASLRAQAISAAQAESLAEVKFNNLARAFQAHLDSDHVMPDTAAFNTVVRACWDARNLCKARGDSLQRADSIDSARADSLNLALHGADTTLARGLQVAQCHILLLLPCLTRTQSLEVGLLGGLALGVILTHR